MHFPVSLRAQGVTILDDWRVMGIRGTGSYTIVMENVFVPKASVGVDRPQGVFHPVWNVVLTVSMPLIMSVYTGIAERAFQLVLEQADDEKSHTSMGDRHN